MEEFSFSKAVGLHFGEHVSDGRESCKCMHT